VQVSQRLRTVCDAKAVAAAIAGWGQQQLLDDTVKEVLRRVYEPGFKVRGVLQNFLVFFKICVCT
jgi:hypothetical protein